jgi:predicted dehydrogenase
MSDKVDIGVIGAGWWASFSHIPALIASPYVETVAINRPDKDGLDKVAETFKLTHAYLDAADMLASENLDGVVIASPHVLHAEHATMALQRGLHVLIEKPMATTAGDARALVALARDKQLQIIMPYGWNYKPMTDAAHRLVSDGWVGEVRHVVAQMASALADLFGGEPMLETRDHLFRPPASTWADPKRCGGYGWGQLTHGLGMLFRLIDLEPARVFARMGMSPAGVDFYDAAVVEFGNGATMALSGSATVPKSRGYQLDIRIFGTEGMLLFDIERARVECIRHDGKTHVEPLPENAGDYEAVEPITRFVDICRGKEVVNPADGVVGMRATALLDAMYRSARSGGMVEV